MVTPAQNNTWAQGHVDPWWGLRHRDLAYVNEPFNDLTSLTEWRRLGFSQTRFTGDMYDMRNSEPAWVDPFRGIFPFERFSWSFYRMTPGCVLPAHRDTYDRFKLIHGLETTHSVVRAIVFLEDWQPGHYAEYQDQAYVNWRAGAVVEWSYDAPHMAANLGLTPRYTLQITGHVDD